MASNFRKNIFIGFGISLSLLIISSAASLLSIRELIESSKLVRDTNAAISELEGVNLTLLAAESNQRGFLLTSDSSVLSRFKKQTDSTVEKLNLIDQLVGSKPDQAENMRRLRETVKERIDYLHSNVEFQQKGPSLFVVSLAQGKIAMDSVGRVIRRMERIEQERLDVRTANMQRFSVYTPVLIVFAAILSLMITIVFYVRIMNDFKRQTRLQKELRAKDVDLAARIGIIRNIADKISSGNYKIRIDDVGKDVLGSLAGSLNKMTESLEYSFELLSQKEWLQAAVAEFNEKLLGEKNIKALSSTILDAVIHKTDSQIGAFYVMNDSSDELYLASGFALVPEAPRNIRIGEGVVGQCAAQRKVLYLENIAEESFTLSFTSGKIKPSSLMIIPLLNHNEIIGVMEIGKLGGYSTNEQLYLRTISEQIGIVIESSQSRRRLQELLEETQSQSEELQTQQNELENINEELRSQSHKLQVSEEELKVQQEELMQANTELEERTTLLEEKNQLILERNSEIQIKARELADIARYKSEFLANMSHELRTPLNSILLLSRLMAENNERNLSPDQIEYARVIQSSGQGLLMLIDEILDLSKIESGKMDIEYASVSVHEIIDDIRSLFAPIAKDKNLEFSISATDGAPTFIHIDKLRVEQILKNLVSNALKFTSRGSVRLTIAPHPTDPSLLGFAVKDTGIGIEKEKQSLVFEAFQQADGSTRRQYGGTGLGLSISRELARLLGGHIVLTSEPGKGSEFILYAPIAKPLRQEASVAANKIDELYDLAAGDDFIASSEEQVANNQDISPVPSAVVADDRGNINPNDKTILIVEDDISFAKALLDFTRENGYKGIVATRGDEGLPLARLFMPIGILLDIKLPVKDGWQVMKELKEDSRTRHIPVHIMSSLEVKNQSISSGAVDFINKPMAFEKLHEAFRKIENALMKEPRKVLIVEENAKHALALSYFLENSNIVSEIGGDASSAIAALGNKQINCVILDMGITDARCFNTIKEIKANPGMENIPVVIFTEKNLSKSEELHIKRYADSIVVKTANSYRRILDEISLFLHLVEKNANGNEQSPSYQKLGFLKEVLKNKTALIADDDVRNIFSLAKALESVGMTVLSAMDGREALEQLQANPGIDIILMDMMMPEMDGYETMKRIREMEGYAHLPIIAVTAKAMREDREKCIRSGASDYITKPIDADQLLSLLRVWLYNKS